MGVASYVQLIRFTPPVARTKSQLPCANPRWQLRPSSVGSEDTEYVLWLSRLAPMRVAVRPFGAQWYGICTTQIESGPEP